jgi:type I restriction enzyme M protein
LLRGPYQPNQYGDVILPFTILRRLDCILEPTKDDVLAEYKKIRSMKVDPGCGCCRDCYAASGQ